MAALIQSISPETFRTHTHTLTHTPHEQYWFSSGHRGTVGKSRTDTAEGAQPPTVGTKVAPRRTLRSLYESELAAAATRKAQADQTSARLGALGEWRDRLWPMPVRMAPHDIPVLSLDAGELTHDALSKLFRLRLGLLDTERR